MLRSPWALLLSALLLGCTPKIGNSCNLSTDCSQLGDRLCDTSEPGGYCTIFNCEPDQCPNSVCVAFDPSLDPACGSTNGGRWPRFETTFCMAPCNSNGDCRDEYECVDLDPNYRAGDAGTNTNLAARAAQVVDLNAEDGGAGYSVCMVMSGVQPPMNTGGVPPICLPPDAGFLDAGPDSGAPWSAYDGGS
jgi:hypothetical protein